ncbi:hypothetical protein GCM10028868_02250 [Virgibacillus kimchii]
MNKEKNNLELATFTLLNPDFSVAETKQLENKEKDEHRKT